MRLTYLGHAGFVMEMGEVRILIDPFFFPAFLGSWFPYPDNRNLLPDVIAGPFDYLYISHLHEDHFDRTVLAQLDKSVKVICPDYRSKGVARRMAALGYQNLIPLAHKQSLEIGEGVLATMFLDTSHKEDSGIMLECDGFRFLDLNDCNTSLTELPGNIDLLAAQYSGAMWYPNCYNYEPAVMKQKVAKVRSDLMKSLIAKQETTQANAYIPCAGPVCFLDPALAEFNERDATIFPVWEDVAENFTAACPEAAVLRIQPGDAIDLPSLAISKFRGDRPSTDLTEYSERRRSEWKEFYKDEHPEISAEDLSAYFQNLQRRNPQLAKNLNKYIRVSADHNSWGIQLGKMAEDFVIEGEDPYPPEYMLITSSRTLRAILDERAGWEEALLSMRVRLRRIPDTFDSRFMGLLRYGNEPIQTLQMAKEAGGSETIEKDGFRLQRFCPHAGEDLTKATICDGVLECPRHHWKWNVNTGDCIEGGALKLRIEAVNQTVSAESDKIPAHVGGNPVEGTSKK